MSEQTTALEEDAITGLLTRQAFCVRLEGALRRGVSASRNTVVAVLDLDCFRTTSATLGRAAADGLLVAVAERLRKAVRRRNCVARLDADQFAVLFAGLEDDAAAAATEHLRACFFEPYSTGDEDFWLTASMGVASAPGDACAAEMLLACAESALLAAKQGGRSSRCFFTSGMRDLRAANRSLERDLRAAAERDELSLVYQPEVHLREYAAYAALGYEALLRWRHPQRGFVAPSEFIPVAEDGGLIVEIGTWVLRSACRAAAAWQEAHRASLRVGVNLSPQQLLDERLVHCVRAALRESGLPGSRLELEITETALMVEPARAAAVLAELRTLDVRLALDDFGTGYSSLAHLRQLPITSLKIDRSFVAGLPGNRDDLAITKAIIELARNLGLEVIAEGVETEEQLVAIRALGCPEAQGFLFGRPLPAEQLLGRRPLYPPRWSVGQRTLDAPVC